MNRHVNAIAGRLSLRPPQRRSLEILDRVMEIVPPGKNIDTAGTLDVIRSEFHRFRILSEISRGCVSRLPPAWAKRGLWALS